MNWDAINLTLVVRNGRVYVVASTMGPVAAQRTWEMGRTTP